MILLYLQKSGFQDHCIDMAFHMFTMGAAKQAS